MNNTLTPGRLADRLEDKIEFDRDLSEQFGAEFFSILARELKKEDHFSIFGFGTFKRLFVEESLGRNPQTGETITIPSHYRVKFTPAGRAAERINAEYAHLKPVILDEERVHEGLLLKAERYILSIPAEPEPPAVSGASVESAAEALPSSEPPEEEEHVVTAVAPDETETVWSLPREEEESVPEPDFGFKKDRRMGVLKIMLAVFLLLMLSLGALWFFLKKDSLVPSGPGEITAEESEAADQPVPAEEPVIQQEAAETEAAAEQPVTPEVETAEPVIPEPAGSSYRIIPGDSFSILAQEKWGNIYLWPYIYSSNRTNYPDPDLIRPGDSIFIPPQPDTVNDQLRIEDSILMAYKRYRDLIREQAGNSRNARRELSADYVLLGGERLYPSFLNRNSGLIRPEDIRRVEELNP